MDVFRITSAPLADLMGTGGLYASGRWHTRGLPIVYTADSRALAILERLVHTDVDDVPDDLVLLRIAVPDEVGIEEIGVVDLPSGWTEPLHPECMARGSAWLEEGRTPLLRVPSVLAPGEHNFLINPVHPGARKLKAVDRRDFAFDERLL